MEWNVKNALSRDVEREHLNKILKEIRGTVDNIDTGVTTTQVTNIVNNIINNQPTPTYPTFSVTLTGDATGSGSSTNLSNITIPVTLDPSVVGIPDAPNDGGIYWRTNQQWQAIPYQLSTIDELYPAGLVVIDADYNWLSREIEVEAGQLVVTNADGTAGNPLLGLATVTPTATGALQLTAFDTFGRRSGEAPATTDNLAEGTTNLYFTNERAQDAVGSILTNSSSIDLTYDDVGNTITAALNTATQAKVDDALDYTDLKNTLVAGANITLTPDDVLERITITSTGGGGGGGGVDTVTGGTGISVDNTDPSNPIVSLSGSVGSVTSVAATGSTGLTVGGSPITTSGTLTFTLSTNLQGWSGIAPTAKFNTPTGTTAQYIRGDGSLATFPTIPSGTVTSVAMTVPTGLSVSGSPITSSGTLALTYAAGYTGYTTAEQTKLSGIATGATNFSYTDVKAMLVAGANVTITANDGLQTLTIASSGGGGGSGVSTVNNGTGITVDNTDPANPIVALSSATQATLAAAVPNTRTISTTAPLTGGGDLSANRTLGISAATTSAAGSMSAADKTKLDGMTIGTSGATIPLNNANNTSSGNQTHTGTETFSGNVVGVVQGDLYPNDNAGTVQWFKIATIIPSASANCNMAFITTDGGIGGRRIALNYVSMSARGQTAVTTLTQSIVDGMVQHIRDSLIDSLNGPLRIGVTIESVDGSGNATLFGFWVRRDTYTHGHRFILLNSSGGVWNGRNLAANQVTTEPTGIVYATQRYNPVVLQPSPGVYDFSNTPTVNGTPLSTSTGTVTSVGLSLPSIFSVTGSPVTTTGTLTATLASQTANTFFAAPNGSAGAPTFRAIVAADIPTLNQNTTGSAATLTTARTIQTNLASTSAASFNGSANVTPGVTGTLPIANGGTGATSAASAPWVQKSGDTMTGNLDNTGGKVRLFGAGKTLQTFDNNGDIACVEVGGGYASTTDRAGWLVNRNASSPLMLSGRNFGVILTLGSSSGVSTLTGELQASSLKSTGYVYSSQNFESTTTAAILATSTAGTVYLRPNGGGSSSGELTVASSGNVVANGPVRSNGSGAAVEVQDRGLGGSYWSMYSSGTALRLWVSTAGDRMSIDASGNVSATNFYATSDRRKKTNLVPFTKSILQGLNVYSFNWLENGNPEVGVIAQEVPPEFVHVSPEGMMSVKEGKYALALIAELRKEVTQLKEKVYGSANFASY